VYVFVISERNEKSARDLKTARKPEQKACLEIAAWIRIGNGPRVDLATAEEVKRLRLGET